ncbi:MAG: dicarboxylate/amino acid:cation symporter [Bacilli bacterium]|nr:dicarboxylate/amino acid:cation symporter [Bacilli bacterium]
MTKRFSLITLGAFGLGILGGLLVPSAMLSIGFLGTVYINLLKMMIIPILFFGIVTALISTEKQQISKVTIRTIILFAVMFTISFLINSGFVSLLKPGTTFTFANVAWEGEITEVSLASFFTSFFPDNILRVATENAILPIILFAFAVGFAINHLDKHKEFLTQLNISINAIFNQILQWIMYLTPIGVFALMGTTVANFGPSVLASGAAYILSAWIGCVIIAILVMILPVWLYCKINPIEYIRKVSEIWMMTLSTCSSAATLPNTIRVCNEKFDVPKELTNIIVPLGCTIHMCGGAVSFSLLALFNMQMYNIPLTFPLFMTMLIVALLINMGAPGIPGGGIVIGATYLSILGVPLTFIGFYAGIYRLLDMAYTTMNVTGDISANLLIKKSLE